MKIKVKNIKIPKCFPYKDYTCKVDRHKFHANLFEDNGGELSAKIGRELYLVKENGKLEDWIDEAMEMSDFYHNLVDFLKEVKYIHNQEKNKL
jgi:hypothetical protein